MNCQVIHPPCEDTVVELLEECLKHFLEDGHVGESLRRLGYLGGSACIATHTGRVLRKVRFGDPLPQEVQNQHDELLTAKIEYLVTYPSVPITRNEWKVERGAVRGKQFLIAVAGFCEQVSELMVYRIAVPLGERTQQEVYSLLEKFPNKYARLMADVPTDTTYV